MPRTGGRSTARDIGKILSVTPTGHLTVRAPSADVVAEGTPVKDSRGVVHGRVVRVFGPVARPYLSVRPRRLPTAAEGLALIGGVLVRE